MDKWVAFEKLKAALTELEDAFLREIDKKN